MRDYYKSKSWDNRLPYVFKGAFLAGLLIAAATTFYNIHKNYLISKINKEKMELMNQKEQVSAVIDSFVKELNVNYRDDSLLKDSIYKYLNEEKSLDSLIIKKDQEIYEIIN